MNVFMTFTACIGSQQRCCSRQVLLASGWAHPHHREELGRKKQAGDHSHLPASRGDVHNS